MALDCTTLRVYCRGTDLSSALQSTSLDQTREEIDTTVLASDMRTWQASFGSVALAHAGLYEDGLNTLAEVFRQAHAADIEPITVCPSGPTVGNIAFLVLAHSAGLTMPEQMAPGQVVKASLRASARAAIPANGQVVYNGTVAADTASTPVLLGAPIVNQEILATIHLLGMTPAPSVVFFLESDTLLGFGSPTVRATSTAQTDRGSVLLRAAGPLAGETYWRVRWDHSGSGSFNPTLISLGLSG